MSACYDVVLKVAFKDEQAAAQAMREKIANAEKDSVNYSLGEHRAEGRGTSSIEDLLRIFLAGWNCTSFTKEVKGKFTYYRNSFNASYGWEGVMMDLLEVLAPYVENLSWIKIWPDSGLDYGIVRQGTVTWKS